VLRAGLPAQQAWVGRASSFLPVKYRQPVKGQRECRREPALLQRVNNVQFRVTALPANQNPSRAFARSHGKEAPDACDGEAGDVFIGKNGRPARPPNKRAMRRARVLIFACAERWMLPPAAAAFDGTRYAAEEPVGGLARSPFVRPRAARPARRRAGGRTIQRARTFTNQQRRYGGVAVRHSPWRAAPLPNSAVLSSPRCRRQSCPVGNAPAAHGFEFQRRCSNAHVVVAECHQFRMACHPIDTRFSLGGTKKHPGAPV